MADTQTAVKVVNNEAPKDVAPPNKPADAPTTTVAAPKADAWYSKWWSGVRTCCGRTDPKDLPSGKADGNAVGKVDVKNNKTTAEADAKKNEVVKETKTAAT